MLFFNFSRFLRSARSRTSSRRATRSTQRRWLGLRPSWARSRRSTWSTAPEPGPTTSPTWQGTSLLIKKTKMRFQVKVTVKLNWLVKHFSSRPFQFHFIKTRFEKQVIISSTHWYPKCNSCCTVNFPVYLIMFKLNNQGFRKAEMVNIDLWL